MSCDNTCNGSVYWHAIICGKNDRPDEPQPQQQKKKQQRQTRPRARDLGIVFEGAETGQFNAITDVIGVEVGYTTIVEGNDVRSGLTIIHPRGKARHDDPVRGAMCVINGNGEVTGAQWLDEFGYIAHPIGLTLTARVGIVRDSILDWQYKNGYQEGWGCPVVCETWNGRINNDRLPVVVPEHVFAACEGAIGGQPIEEGSVGGGTACAAFEYKSGCGTASRRAGQWMVGVFVQSNCGSRGNLKITGVPIQDSGLPSLYDEDAGKDLGSIAIIIATDAPLLPNQLRILAKHATHGIARTGALSGTLSGDFAIAFSTANPGLHERLRTASETDDPVVGEPGVYNEMLHVLSDQVVFATEEAIINALIASDTMEGFGHVAYKLPLKVIAKSFSEHRLPRINI